MTHQGTIKPTENPVSGMTVEPEQARQKGLTLRHEGTPFVLPGQVSLLLDRAYPHST